MKKENHLEIKTGQRPFVMVYHDFLNSKLLETPQQKLIFIYLKMHDNPDKGCFPSITTISNETKISKTKVKETLKQLEEKRVIKRTIRYKDNGSKDSTLYTLYDLKELWTGKDDKTENDKNENKKTENIQIDDEEKKLISLLVAKGYKVTKETEPESSPMPTKAEEETDSKKLKKSTMIYHSCKDYKSNLLECQDAQRIVERYPLEQIKEYFCYEAMVHDNPSLISDIDSVMNILHETLNTTKETIRISKEDKATATVVGKLMKLTHLEIMYAIEQYNKQTGKINFSTNYMLKLLYVAKEQMHLDTTNRVQYDTIHQKQTEKVEEVKKQQQNYKESQTISKLEQVMGVCENYSEEQKNKYKERYKKTVLQGINKNAEENKDSFDRQGVISDLEKEWSKTNQGISMPSESQRIQSNETSKEVKVSTKSGKNYNDYEQRQYSQEFMDDL